MVELEENKTVYLILNEYTYEASTGLGGPHWACLGLYALGVTQVAFCKNWKRKGWKPLWGKLPYRDIVGSLTFMSKSLI